MMKREDIKKYKYTVLGGGRSGIGAAVLLKKAGAEIFLSESLPEDKLLYFNSEKLKKYNISYETGKNSEKIYDADIIVASPGIAPHSPVLTKAKEKGIKILSEIEVASYFCDSKIIAVTGTNGKTTTTVLTGELLRNAGLEVKVCGNVGTAFSEIVEDANKDSIIVLELSSFQLEYTYNFKPMVSMILNITPDHIDWHGTMEKYIEAKFKINQNQSDDDLFIFNYDDPELIHHLNDYKGTLGAFSEKIINNASLTTTAFLKENSIYLNNKKLINCDEIFIQGGHNYMNAMAAMLAVKKFNISDEIISKTMKEFKGVEHRIEFVKEINGVKFYNDSKATNYDSMYAALKSFNREFSLIMGGKKGVDDFEKVEKIINEKVKAIYAIGQSKEAIKKYFNNKTHLCNTLDAAVNEAYSNSKPGDIVLFSPGYKSFDMFDNFEERGKSFKNSVNNLTE